MGSSLDPEIPSATKNLAIIISQGEKNPNREFVMPNKYIGIYHHYLSSLSIIIIYPWLKYPNWKKKRKLNSDPCTAASLFENNTVFLSMKCCTPVRGCHFMQGMSWLKNLVAQGIYWMIFALKKTTTSPSMLKVIPICKRLQVNKYIYIYICVSL